jgi:predicted dehydrogenase
MIGLGRVAWLLEQDPLRPKPCSHLGAWQQQGGVQLTAACDNNSERLEEFARRHPQVRTYSRYEDMLSVEQLDLLSVAAYADTRCEMVLAACQAGVKGIWCEKAMSTTLEEARRMQASTALHGVHLALSYPRRWSPVYQWVASGLRSGELGRLESINVQFPSNFVHTGTHAFDVLRMWGGEVAAVRGWLDANSARVENSGYQFGKPAGVDGHQPDLGGFALLEFENGGRATVQAERKDYFRFEFEVLTDTCMLRVGNTQQEYWRKDQSPNFTGFQELARQHLPVFPDVNVFSAIAHDLAEGLPPLCNGEDGVKALEIALAVHESHQFNHRPVTPTSVSPHFGVSSR